MSVDTRMLRALDAVEIQQVVATYALGQDSHQTDDLVLADWDRAFTEDATTDYTAAGMPHCGYRELYQLMRGHGTSAGRMSGYSGWQHMLSIPTIHIDGDLATARTDYLATHRLRTIGAEGTRFDVSGAFHDNLVRTEVGWRIRHRRLEVYFGGQISIRATLDRGAGHP